MLICTIVANAGNSRNIHVYVVVITKTADDERDQTAMDLCEVTFFVAAAFKIRKS